MLPSTDQPLAAAVHWIEALLIGSTAEIAAVLAVALLGAGLMQGRWSWRQGGAIIVGCFVIFAAPLIAQGLLAGIGDNADTMNDRGSPGDQVPTYRPSQPYPSVYDPYDGAAVPPQDENNLLN
jgi:type IV secretory pathway VirB2 component (pilin)